MLRNIRNEPRQPIANGGEGTVNQVSLLSACFAYARSLGFLPLPVGIPPPVGDSQARLCLYAKTGIM